MGAIVAPKNRAPHLRARGFGSIKRMRSMPGGLKANDAALRAARRKEERLRTRDLLQSAEAFVEFYDRPCRARLSRRRDTGVFYRASVGCERPALTLVPNTIFASSRSPRLAAITEVPPSSACNPGSSTELRTR